MDTTSAALPCSTALTLAACSGVVGWATTAQWSWRSADHAGDQANDRPHRQQPACQQNQTWCQSPPVRSRPAAGAGDHRNAPRAKTTHTGPVPQQPCHATHQMRLIKRVRAMPEAQVPSRTKNFTVRCPRIVRAPAAHPARLEAPSRITATIVIRPGLSVDKGQPPGEERSPNNPWKQINMVTSSVGMNKPGCCGVGRGSRSPGPAAGRTDGGGN